MTMSKPAKTQAKVPAPKNEELPDAALDKVAGGGQSGAQGDPKHGMTDEQIANGGYRAL